MEITNTTTSRNRSIKIIASVILFILIVLAAVYFILGYFKLGSAEYQAVFLSNGQVYFGKMSRSGKWIVLKDVYYLQVTQNLQEASGNSSTAPNSTTPTNNNQATQPEIKLVKLGSELHGPEDRMYIDGDKILFWEDMKPDSKVIEAINKYVK